MKVRSKVCGIKYPGDLKDIAGMLPNYLGFIFYAPSKRFMRETLKPEDLAAIPSSIIKTGVFVNEELNVVLDMVNSYELDALQLHGDEAPDYLNELKSLLPNTIQIIKAFGIDASIDWQSLNDYQECCDLFLFDTKTANYGGSGRRFDLDILAEYNNVKPVMMSGGIGIDDLHEILTIPNFDLWGIDMNSRLETSPGKKDIAMVDKALKTIKHYERRG